MSKSPVDAYMILTKALFIKRTSSTLENKGKERRYHEIMPAQGVYTSQCNKPISPLSVASLSSNRSLPGGRGHQRIMNASERVIRQDSGDATNVGTVSNLEMREA